MKELGCVDEARWNRLVACVWIHFSAGRTEPKRSEKFVDTKAQPRQHISEGKRDLFKSPSPLFVSPVTKTTSPTSPSSFLLSLLLLFLPLVSFFLEDLNVIALCVRRRPRRPRVSVSLGCIASASVQFGQEQSYSSNSSHNTHTHTHGLSKRRQPFGVHLLLLLGSRALGSFLFL